MVDIDVVHCVVNYRAMIRSCVLSRSSREGCFGTSACSSGILSGSSIGWEAIGDVGAMVRPGEVRHCQGGAGQSSCIDDNGGELHFVKCPKYCGFCGNDWKLSE